MFFKKYIQNNIIIIKLYITNNTDIGLSRRKKIQILVYFTSQW